MIGYVNVCLPELKVKDLSKYRAYYCGLCRFLCLKFGEISRFTLSYDFTFLLILHSSLYEPKNNKHSQHCPTHIASKTNALTNKYTAYAADMNLFMTYKKLEDDLIDDNKAYAKVGIKLLEKKVALIRRKYPKKTAKISYYQEEIRKYENTNKKDIEYISSLFGKLLAEIFVVKKDEWSKSLSRLGYYLGKFIYILDAFDDMQKDALSNNYNPLLNDNNIPAYSNEQVRQMLLINISCACVEFEKLPCIREYDILHNILYSGVWKKYNEIVARNKLNRE